MTDDARIDERLLRWEELREQGVSASAEELCRDAPALAEPLRRAIAELEQLRPVLTTADAEAGDSTEIERAAAERLPELPGYEVLAAVGQGGAGIVYRARDCALGREVALKMLRGGVLAGPTGRRRFHAEAQALARLDHPHVAPIYAAGEHQGKPYFTMKYLPGGSLARHLARFGADPRAAAALVEKVARAVHYLHGKNILHRDLKPLNILLDEHDEPCVSDFGLAKFLDADMGLTRTGAVMGTLPYMAPEQAEGRPEAVGPATDVWALGVILYELLTGRRPFATAGRMDLARLIATADPPAPRSVRPDLDPALEAIVRQCLEKAPARRYAAAGALADDLAGWGRGETRLDPSPAWPARLWRAVRGRR
jgi:serine/threonine-protein kinase